MSKLASVIAKAKHMRHPEKPEKKAKKCYGSLEKAIQFAKERIENDTLEKGCLDAMYHHALHAKAADSACYQSLDGKSKPVSPEEVEKCKKAASKHEFMMLRHALEMARKKGEGSWRGNMTSKLRKYIDFMESEGWDMEKDPDYQKALKHYQKGGEFKHHEDDGDFKEDYKE